MKLNKKLISLLAIAFIVPAFLFSCAGGESSGGGENVPPEEFEGLKFTATQNGSSVGYAISSGSLPNIHIQYSRDDGNSWQDWTDGSNSIILNNGESVCVRNTSYTLSENYPNHPYFYFIMDTGEIEASGDISSMINYGELKDHCFAGMFLSCTALTKAKITLPATKLTESCYNSMFNDCTALTSAPSILPATELKLNCYKYMFSGCTSLTATPTLPATSLADNCYAEMFKGCTNLESAAELKATKLMSVCYGSMFKNCTKLVTPPAIHASELANRCCENMFEGCTSLTSAPILHATELEDYCYEYMFNGCTNLKIKEEMGETTRPNKIFTCPTIGTITNPVTDMFTGTTGDFTTGTPTEGDTYYYY